MPTMHATGHATADELLDRFFCFLEAVESLLEADADASAERLGFERRFAAAAGTAMPHQLRPFREINSLQNPAENPSK